MKPSNCLSRSWKSWFGAAVMLVGCAVGARAQEQKTSPVVQVRTELRELRDGKAEADTLAAKVPEWLAMLFAAADPAAPAATRFDALTLAIDVSLLAPTNDAASAQRVLAIERVLAEYGDDLARMSTFLRGRTAIEGLRAKLFDTTKNAAVKALCLYSEGAELALKSRSAKLEPADEKRMFALLERVVAEFATEKDDKGRLWKDVAAGALAALRDLAVGKLAPEISGADLDGAAFKLSDYRGKIVVLDFWGNW